MVKKSAILLVVLLGLALVPRFPGFSSETYARITSPGTAPAPFAQIQFKNPFARSEERFRQDRHFLFDSPADIHWICSYGTADYDYLYTIKQTREGGYIAAGKSYDTDNGSSDAVLIKINEEGSLEWQKSYGREGNDASYYCSVVETSNDGYILATDTGNIDSSIDILVLKLSSDGSILWQKTYGREATLNYSHGSIQQTRDGGYILAGTSLPQGTWISDVIVLKFDPAGNILWDKILKAWSPQWGDSVQQTPDGGYIVAGGSHGYPWFASDKVYPLILKLDSYGNIEWQKLYEGYGRLNNHRANVIANQDDGYVVADFVQYSQSYVPWGWEFHGDLWIFKLDPAGNILWQNLYGGSDSWEESYSLCETRDGGYAVGGYTNSYGSALYNGWILKLDSMGNIAWQKTYGEKTASGIVVSLSQKNNGDFLAAGYIVRIGSTDMLALNIDEEGEIGEDCEWVRDSDAIATPTSSVPIDTNLVPMNAGLISKFSNASSADFNLTQELLCWNLNQPPINVSLRTETNRSLYVKELYNVVSWEPNPLNDKFNIA